MFDSLFYIQELAEAHAIFNPILACDLYKCVDFKVIHWLMRSLFQKHITATSIVQACGALSPASTLTETSRLLSKNLFAIMHFGMKEKNPLYFIRFYLKHDATHKLFFSYISLPHFFLDKRCLQCSTRWLFGDDAQVVYGRPLVCLYQKAKSLHF